MLITTSVIFAISAVGFAMATAFWFFIVSRITCALAVGAASLLSPTYIAVANCSFSFKGTFGFT